MKIKKLFALPLPEPPAIEGNSRIIKYRADVVTVENAETLAITFWDANEIKRLFMDSESFITQNVTNGKKHTADLYNLFDHSYYNWLFERTRGDDTKNIQQFAEAHGWNAADKDQYYGCLRSDDEMRLIQRRQLDIRKRTLNEKHCRIKWEIDREMEKVTPLPEDIKDWIYNSPLRKSRYIFYRRSLGKDKPTPAVCTNCGDIEVINPKRGEGTCPKCGCTTTYKTVGNTSDAINDIKKFSYIQPYGNELIMRGFKAERRYQLKQIKRGLCELTLESLNIETVTYELFREIYNPSRVVKNSEQYYYGTFFHTEEQRWCKVSNTFGYMDLDDGYIYPNNLNNIFQRYFKSNIDAEAIAKSHPHSPRYFIDKVLSPEYVFLENFVRAGLNNLTAEFMESKYSERVKVNNRKAASPKEVLGVTKDELDFFRKVDITPDQYTFYMKYAKTHSLCQEERATFERLCELKTLNPMKIEGFLQYMTLHQVVRYLTEQRKNYDKDTKYNDIAGDWRDYIDECKKLKWNLAARMVICPANLPEAHRNAGTLIEVGGYKRYEKGIADRYKALKSLEYSSGKFIIFPFRNVNDFIIESNVLSHCVKQYASNHSTGATTIFACRLKENPEQSYFTVQLTKSGKLEQNRGKHNCSPPPEVSKFVSAWIKKVVQPNAEVLTVKPKKSKKEKHYA